MRLMIFDDDPLILTALQTILSAEEGITVCASGTNGAEAVTKYEELLPDVLLTDIRMPFAEGTAVADEIPGGLEASEQILKAHPDARILLLTTFLDDEYIIRALRLGVSGYLLKQDYATLAAAIRSVHGGQNVFGSMITARMPALLGRESGKDPALTGAGLNEREAEITALIAEGLSNKEIAERMFLSEGTVRNYLSVILEKLQLRDRTQLAIFYLTGKRTGE
ncbi:MAG: response regulator transcription factor [Lachnospiraceae bacterium]|nr:response regulator transcription factor [Lachnospiraceae bacterium]